MFDEIVVLPFPFLYAQLLESESKDIRASSVLQGKEGRGGMSDAGVVMGARGGDGLGLA